MTGAELRDEGVARVDRATHNDWKHRCDSIIQAMAQSGLPFTVEDVRVWVPEPTSPNAWGARFLAACKAGWIECTGYAKATRAKAHSRVVAIYRRKGGE